MEFFIHSLFYKALPNSDVEITKQLNIFECIIKEIQGVDNIFSKLYINKSDSSKNQLGQIFPSDSAFQYLFESRKKDPFKTALLWSGENDCDKYVSISFSITGLRFGLEKKFDIEIFITLFKSILKNLKCKYLFLSNSYFMDNRVFEHRQPVSSICYVPKMINEKDIPHLYSKFDVNNNLNQGSILVFDQNLFDESEQMKKKIQENAIALVDLDLIPEAELDSDFFNEVEF